MPSPRSSVVRTSAILGAIALLAGVTAVLVNGMAPAADVEDGTDAEPSRTAPRRRASDRAVEPPRPVPTPADPYVEDLWALDPGDAGRRELEETSFLVAGGIRTVGSGPASARGIVSGEGWEQRMEAELARGLEQEIFIGGAASERLDCQRGRCLIELRFDSMTTALERVEPLREWLGERVPCAAYSEGPDEGDDPALGPSQQIWLLCGQVTPEE